jgi:hypothetical protein
MEQSESPINESKPQSKIALIALILSLSSSLFCGVSIALLGIFTDTFHYGPSGFLALCASCLGVLTPLVGIILGGVALARKEPQKAMAAIAIILGVLAIIATGFVLFLTFVICCTAI